MLPPFISDTKDKHPTFILASYGGECYRHSFPTLKTNTPIFILASHGAECYRHSFLTLMTNTRHLFLASYGAECYRHSFQTFFFATKFPVPGNKKLIINDFSGLIEPPRKKVSVEPALPMHLRCVKT